MRFGVHTSIAGGLPRALERAHELGCDALQVFLGNPRGWTDRPLPDDEIMAFRRLRRRLKLRPLVVHLTYLPNLASADRTIRRRSLSQFQSQLHSAKQLAAELFVLHPGSARDGSRTKAILRVAEALRAGLDRTPDGPTLLLENTAGGGGLLGAEPEELAAITAATDAGERVGVCLDTAHACAAGFDIHQPGGMTRLRRRFLQAFGRDPLCLLHLNDLRAGFGAKHDRHEHIGRGTLGEQGLQRVLHAPGLRRLPAILETPVEEPGDDARNLARARALAALDARPVPR